jgi:hypothetical protein
MNYILFCVFLWLVLGYIIKIPKRGIPILNFEAFEIENFDSNHFEELILFFLRSGYQVSSTRQLLEFIEDENKKLTNKPLFLTFEISKFSQIEAITSILEKYNLPVLLFLQDEVLNNLNILLNNSELTYSLLLKNINKNYFTIGLSSLSSKSYKVLNSNEIDFDLENTIRHFTESNLSVLPILKYPFGVVSSDSKTLFLMKERMNELGVKFGLAAGDKLNKVPIEDSKELVFISVKMTDSFEVLKQKLKGKYKVKD